MTAVTRDDDSSHTSEINEVCYHPTMITSHPEPGFISVFRFYAFLRLAAFVFIPLATMITGMGFLQAIQTGWESVFSLINSLMLLIALYWRWLGAQLGRWYVPILLALASLGLLLEQLLFRSRPEMSESGFIIILVILVAWQYNLKIVIAYIFVIGLSGATLTLSSGAFTPYFPGSPRAEWIAALGFLIARIFAYFLLGYVVNRLAYAQRAQRQALEQANLRLISHAETLEQLAAIRERLRLSRELHDTLAHTLSALAVQTEALQTVWKPDSPKAQAMLSQMVVSTRSGLDETRRALRALRAAPIEQLGLVEAVRQMAQDCAARGGWSLDLHLPDNLEDLTMDVEQCFFRIAQEALTNTLRHAHPKKVEVLLEDTGSSLILEIKDDGSGFDAQKRSNQIGLGLQGMQERADLINAFLEISSQPNHGVRIHLEWKGVTQ